MVELVLWDFDGVLADSIQAAHRLYNQVCEHFQIQPPPWKNFQEFRGWMSGDWRENVRRLGLNSRIPEVKEMYRRYLAEADPRLYPGIHKVLRNPDGYRQAVLSGEDEAHIRKMLNRRGVEDCFERVIGGDTFDFAKPDPRAMSTTLELFRVEPKETVYIGDTVVDVSFSRLARTKVIATTYGLNPKSDLLVSGPDYIVDHADEIPHAIASL